MSDPGILRRLLLTVLVVVTAAVAIRLLASILAADGLALTEAGILGLFALTFAWISIAFFTALTGFARLAFGEGAPRPGAGLDEPAPQAPITTRTALVMPVCHEDPDAFGARLAAVYRSLERAGALEPFDLFILSDSRDEAAARAEVAVWAGLCRELGASGRLFYRRRSDNHGRKSGNIAEFCRRWGRRYDFFVVLDADSVMSASTLLRLVRLMQANPGAALIQTVPQPVRATTLFARVLQFAGRLYAPLFAAGAAYWFPGKSSYWGHNAILRTPAFMACCGLPSLPGAPPLGGEILSHDFVEAALLRRAGWGVWLVPELGGSWEELPPTLEAFATRDRRWCQGNLQHARLLTLKGLCPVSRVHLACGIMSYLASPLWLLLLVLATVEAVRIDPADWVYFPEANVLFPVWPVPRVVELLGLFSVTMAMLLLPKLLALGLTLADPARRGTFGGAGPLLRSTIAEILLAVLLAPILMIRQTVAVAGTLLGRQVGWRPQRRDAGGGRPVPARHGLGVAALGLGWGLLAWWQTPGLLIWLSPVLAGLVLGVPLAALSGRADLGRRARARGWFLTPEECAPPPEIAALEPRALPLRETPGHALLEQPAEAD